MAAAPHFLLLVDDPDDCELTCRELQKEFGRIETLRITDEAAFESALAGGGIDLVVTDLRLAWSDGLSVLRRVRQRLPDCPVIMLAGEGTEEVAVEAMKLGLDDCVLKEAKRIVRLGAAARAAMEKSGMRVDRRRSDEALRESEERFRLMAEHIDQVFYIASFNPPRMLYVSPAYERVWGRSVQSLYDDPLSWLEAIPDEDRPGVEAAVFGGGEDGPYTIAYRIRRLDGSLRWIEARGARFKVGEEGSYRMVGAAVDITDRWLAEEFQGKLASLTASGIHPVLEFDAAGSISYHNAAAEPIIEALRSTEPRETLQAEIEAIVAECLRTRERAIGLETLVGGRTFSWAFVPVPERNVVHAWVTDISHHLELEARLRQSEKMEAVGRLAGGIAHDFNNLITVMLGHAGFLLEELPADSPLREDVARIREAAGHAVDLSRRLLAFGRRQIVAPRVIRMTDAVEGTLRMFRRLLPESIEVVREPGQGPDFVRIDPGQMEQVVLNLALNARDAMPRGGRLTVRTGCVELSRGYAPRHIGLPPGRYVMLSVSDTGTGIDRETMTHLFEPFYTTKEWGRGTGLGLATVHGIVKQAGGDIWVDSEPGAGSTFTIYLPRASADAEAAPPPHTRRAASGGSETILLVEDEQRIREMAGRVLRAKGFRVLEAAHGEDALETARRHAGPIHLLVCDVVMPVMGGADLAARLTIQRPGTKVLYISGYAGEPAAGAPIDEPDRPLLPKPFTPGGLVAKVREVLDSV